MKVFVVRAENCEAYEDYLDWIEGVFSSKELAENYIDEEQSRYERDNKRIDELDELYCRDQLTEEGIKELRSLKDYWLKAWRCCPRYWSKEYEMN